MLSCISLNFSKIIIMNSYQEVHWFSFLWHWPLELYFVPLVSHVSLILMFLEALCLCLHIWRNSNLLEVKIFTSESDSRFWGISQIFCIDLFAPVFLFPVRVKSWNCAPSVDFTSCQLLKATWLFSLWQCLEVSRLSIFSKCSRVAVAGHICVLSIEAYAHYLWVNAGSQLLGKEHVD